MGQQDVQGEHVPPLGVEANLFSFEDFVSVEEGDVVQFLYEVPQLVFVLVFELEAETDGHHEKGHPHTDVVGIIKQ